MSKRSRRPGREAIKEQRKARKQAQRELRRRQQAEGFSLPPSSTQPNQTSAYKDVEEERAARTEIVSEQIKVFRAMLPILLQRLSKIPDLRNPKKNKHKLTVLLIYGILCFAFQMSSRRQANREMTCPMFEENLRGLFPELEKLPHADTLARLLARIDVTQIEQAHLDMIDRLIRNKKFRRYLIRGCYPVAVDGTQKFSRAALWAAECLERKVRTKKLEANLAFANGMVIPLLSEVLNAQEGDSQRDKQDCEQRAFHRLAQRLKNCFSRLSILLLLDGLYPNGPIIELCRRNNWDFMMVLQDKSLPSVWEELQGLKKFQSQNRLAQKWGDRRQQFWWVNDIPYDYKDPATGQSKTQKVHAVICEESWEEIAPASTQMPTGRLFIAVSCSGIRMKCSTCRRRNALLSASLLALQSHTAQSKVRSLLAVRAQRRTVQRRLPCLPAVDSTPSILNATSVSYRGVSRTNSPPLHFLLSEAITAPVAGLVHVIEYVPWGSSIDTVSVNQLTSTLKRLAVGPCDQLSHFLVP